MSVRPKGQLCEGCPRLAFPRCSGSVHNEKINVLFVSDQPDPLSLERGQPLSGHGGRIIQTAIKAVMQAYPKYQAIRYAFTYGVQCNAPDDDSAPDKVTTERCSTHLRSTIQRFNPAVIVVLGATAFKQLGFKSLFSDSQHKFVSNPTMHPTAPIYVSFGEKQLIAQPGIFEMFKMNLVNVFDRVQQRQVVRPPLSELAKNYRTPKTIDDAIAVCREILEYTENPVDLEKWALSVDTETNTLSPEKDTAKIISYCFGWATGKAATILYDHPHAGADYLARLDELKPWIVRVLQSKKPKIFHNAKFDLKFIELRYGIEVMAVTWDTLLGEHLLDEDKKGNYGLKDLTANFMPHYTGYEDKLHDMLEAGEGSKVEEAQKEIDDLAPVIAPEHAGFLEELREYKNALIQYEKDVQENQQKQREYDLAFDDYAFQKSHLNGLIAAWEIEVQDWPKGQRGKPKKPTRWFTKPEKPVVVKEPKKPKDPRSKKEQEISRDAGFETIPLHDLQVYGAVDADVTRQLSIIQSRRIKKEQSRVIPLMRTHAIPASRSLGRMEYYGTRVDQAYIDVLEEALAEVEERTSHELYQMAGHMAPTGKPMNLNGSQMLAGVIYNWGWTHPDGTRMPPLECVDFTKKGQAQVSEKVLRKYLAYEDEDKTIPTREAVFIEQLLKYRKASKARNTFLANIRALSKRDGFLHTKFHLNGTGTGRTSSSDCNMQNIPKWLAGWNIKKLFIPDDDSYLFVNVDYKGAEVRVFTAYAHDKALIQALNDGLDMHSFFASKVFNKDYELYANRDNAQMIPDAALRKQLDSQRSQIKRVVFGILYGAGPEKIAETIGISEEYAGQLIDLLYKMFPEIELYKSRVEREVDYQKYVETHFGRRRRFPLAHISRHRGRACRQARNFKIQSTSSDIVIGQLIEMDEPLRRDIGGRLLLTVHDSIVFQWPKKYIHQLEDFVVEYAENRVKTKYPWLPVPFKADIEVGHNYGECMSIPKYLAKHPIPVPTEGIIEEYELLNELRNSAFDAAG